MATQVQFRRGTTIETNNFIGATGEVTVDTTKHICVVHDGIQVGGYPLLLENGLNSALSPGSLSSCALKFANDSNTGIISPGNDQLAIVTGGVARLSVDSSGLITVPGNVNIGVGTTGLLLSSPAGASSYITTSSTNTSTDLIFGTATAIPIRFITSNAERLRIDSSGRLLVGTSTARSNLTFGGSGISPLYQVESTGSESSISITRNATNNNSNARLVLAKNNSATLGTNAIVDSGEVLGEIAFNGNDGTNFIVGANITGEVDGTPGTNDMPGRLVFSTTADNAASPTERLRIDSSGTLSIGTSANPTAGTFSRPVVYLKQLSDPANGFAGIHFEASGEQSVLGIGYDGTTQAFTFDTSFRTTGAFRPIAFKTSNTERLRIDTSGNVGIGSTGDPGGYGAKLWIDTTSNTTFTVNTTGSTSRSQLVFRNSNANGEARIYNGTGGPLTFYRDASTEAARIDSSGRLLVGTSTSPSAGDGQYARFVVQSNTVASSAYAAFARNQAGAVTLANADIALLSFTDNAGNSFGRVECYADAAGGAGSYPGRLSFSTTASGSASPTERLRIDSNGCVGVGMTPDNQAYRLQIYNSSQDVAAISLGNNVSGSGAANGFIIVQNQADTQLLNRENGYLSIATNNTERLRIDSSGRVLVGTSSASTATSASTARIQIVGHTGATEAPGRLVLRRNETSSNISLNEQIGQIYFGDNEAGEYALIECASEGTAGAGDYPGRLVFSTTADGAASPTEAMRINNQQELLIGTTTRTANGGVLQISNGITFPGTQSACSDANTLDDYEEGTFTPTVIGTTLAGTGTYSTQSGKYVKVGGKVYVEIAMAWSAHTGTGNMQFSGLPFTSASAGNSPGLSFGRISNIALTANNLLLGYVANNSTVMPLRQYAVGGSAEASVPIDTAGEVNFSATYMVV